MDNKILKKNLTKEFNYNKKYDFDDIKLSIIIQDYFKSWEVSCDYEEIICIINLIKKEWKKDFENLNYEKQGYIQAYCYDFLEENKIVIIKTLNESCNIPF